MSAFCETIYSSAQKTYGLRKRLDAYCLEKSALARTIGISKEQADMKYSLPMIYC